jgi:hypothetical protein
VRNRLIVGSLALFAVRLTLSAIRSGPVIVADEIGYLTNARALAGGLPGHTSLRLFHVNRQSPPFRYVLSSRSWRRWHPKARATLLWSEGGRDEALWRLSGSGASRRGS